MQTSGMEMTPTLCATESPIDLLMANPGIDYPLIHTLSGRSCFAIVRETFDCLTSPPFCSIRNFSFKMLGLWSVLSWITCKSFSFAMSVAWDWSRYETLIARESPKLPQWSLVPSIRTPQIVLPVYLISIF